ncbi:uncharacterized protein [Epargyreus clarus]|uniref:uncharacterized protein n=1 Tax=Epargyreus clarus TaxID=520877 RepID=UPI003C2D8830
MASTMYFGGVEGGATHSNLVICDQTGMVRGRAKGLGTNHWTIGIDECANRVIAMLHAAKIDAGIPLMKPLDSLGLTLSGCEQDSSNADLAAGVRQKDPACAKAIYVASDTAGSLFTGATNGGMVLIAGTGSNALLRTPDGQQYGCGGWGYLLGDEGGAYWIAHRAVKMVFDDADGLRRAPHCTERLWRAVQDHFDADNKADLLPHAYKHFDKSHFAGLTAKLSSLADDGDALSQHLFADAGAALAAHVAALAERAETKHNGTFEINGQNGATSELENVNGASEVKQNGSANGQHGANGHGENCFGNALRVVCVGSVWNSWDALKPGALKQLADRRVKQELELVRLRVSSAMGAAWLAAKHIGYELPRDDSAFCEVFYTYRPENGMVNGKNDSHGCGLAAGVLGYVGFKEKLFAATVSSDHLSGRRDKYNFIADVVAVSAPSVVYIEIRDSRRVDPYTGVNLTLSNGSGFIVKEDGLILTNAHVVVNKPNTIVSVRLMNGSSYTGVIEDVDMRSDLATLRIPVEKLPTMKLGTSADIRPGEWVVAMGSPLALSNTVTAGVVSSTQRNSEELGLRGRDMVYIQTDAPITFGNSGGPLVNLDGEAIGINAMKVTSGISFAIPIDYVKEFLAKKDAKPPPVSRRYLGITMLSLSHNILQELRMRNPEMPSDIDHGILVFKVIIGSPAYNGGLQPGDIVTSMNNKPVHSASDIYSTLESTTGALQVEVVRGRAKFVLKIIPEIH